MDFIIRNELKDDFRKVEELTREAFWNLYVEGCSEHYLAHIMRDHPDFVKELDYVALYEDEVIGNIMYTKSFLVDEAQKRIDAVTFGPVSIVPELQSKGAGSLLIKHSMKKAKAMGFKAVVIYGNPRNYCKHGFKNAKDYNVSDAEGKYPYSLLVAELEPSILQGAKWHCVLSDVYNFNPDAAEEYDKSFPLKQKEHKYSQDEFMIACRAYLA